MGSFRPATPRRVALTDSFPACRTAELVQVAGNFVESIIFGSTSDRSNVSADDVKESSLYPQTVADFIRDYYMGYCHLRASELRR